MKKIFFILICMAMATCMMIACSDSDRFYTDDQKKEIQQAEDYLKADDPEYPTPKTAEMACITGDIGIIKKVEKKRF